ncbi:TonB-dependent receptor [Portibacter marinus]|uniref:TonB-dependent receptor n=1 Tax=Portibacter marinus TaxID=2898660 RepID=UPI001F1C0819|nr:TonB-dependent receptor [Portibacter marinus]
MRNILRIACAILSAVLLQVPSVAQKDILDRKVTLTIEQGELKQIFENLEKNNDVVVSYSSSIVDISARKTLDTTTYICSELFSLLLEEQPVRAISRGAKILIIPDPSKNITFNRLRPRNFFTINGYVKDAETGEILIGASVYNPVTNRGTITNEFGYYSFTMPQGSQTINYSFVGYSPVSRTFKVNKRLRADIYLKSDYEIEEIIVIDQDSSMIWRGREKISLDEIRDLPAVFGEVDVIKSISLLPGIQSGNEAQGGLLVRGGSPDQNLIMLDGIPLYEVNHLFGLVSMFNEDAINNVNLYKSDFSAKYGGRLSSVVDIQLKDGNYKNFGGSATLGVLGGKLNVEGPIQKEKSSFNVAGRTSWIGGLVGPTVNNFLEVEGTRFNYYDFNVKIKREFQTSNSLTFSAYHGRDNISFIDNSRKIGDFNLSTNNQLSWGTDVASMRWSRLIGPKVFANLTMGFVNYNYLYNVQHDLANMVDPSIEDQRLNVASTSRILDRIVKLDFDYFRSNKLDIKYGLGYTLHTYNPSVKQASRFLGSSIQEIFPDIIATNTAEFTAYGESYYRPFANLSIHTGLHFATYVLKDKTYRSLQPRLSVNLGLPWQGFLGISYSRMNQFIHLLGNPGLGLPVDLWVPSTTELAPEISDQFSLGYNMDVFENYRVSTSVYYKTFKNLIEFRSAYDLFNPVVNNLSQQPVFEESRDWESRVDSGTGLAYGWEAQIKRREGRWTGSVSYTYGRSIRTFQEINRGEAFPYRYDRKHDVSVTSVFHINPRVSLGALWIYGTGNAITLPLEGFLDDNGNEILNYQTRNNFRLPPYHRFDISLNYDREFGNYKFSSSIGAYNLYNRQNPYYVYLFQNPNTDEYSLRQISIFPILPYINVKLKI